ncbi:hypothetical protein [Streptomyces sp. TLI_105]|uniref:hypothetical protein n=1 Tax=Streptomyces sp. TLI_105 TaxID=1881019 RepID=UPI000899B16A|nr:hypothetical protein [Streptomyces sp. TLI_105]SEC88961.1 hypothetical protein SAMN05428939_3549 [Streptomyces sp. TLI_105]
MNRKHIRRIGAAAGAVAALVSVAVVSATNATGSQVEPTVPGTLRVFAGPYEQAQFCENGPAPVISGANGGALAASPVKFGKDAGKNRSYHSLKATFEVGRPGEAALITKTEKIWPNGMVFNLALGAGELKPGAYQFRLRTIGGDRASDWTPWCGFTVTR